MSLNKIRKRELCLVDMGQAYEGVETRYTSALRVISSNHPRTQRRRSNAHVSCGFGQWIGCEVLGILLRVCDRDSWGFLQSGTDECLRILNLPAKVEARNEAFAKIKSPTSKTYELQCASYRRSSNPDLREFHQVALTADSKKSVSLLPHTLAIDPVRVSRRVPHPRELVEDRGKAGREPLSLPHD